MKKNFPSFSEARSDDIMSTVEIFIEKDRKMTSESSIERVYLISRQIKLLKIVYTGFHALD